MSTRYVFPKDDFGTALAAEAGVPYQAYQPMLKQSGLSGKDWARLLHVSERTLQRIQEDKRKLDIDASERIIAIRQVFDHGKETFGKEENFIIWIQREIPYLSGKRPIDLMTTLAGLRFIDNYLGQIDYGILA